MVDMSLWEFIEPRQITRRDRSTVAVDCWSRPCARCGEPFVIMVPQGRTSDTSSSFASKHCELHRLTREEVMQAFIAGAAVARLETARRALRWQLQVQALLGDISNKDPPAFNQRPRAKLTAQELQAHRKASNLRYRLRVRNRLEAERTGTRIFHVAE